MKKGIVIIILALLAWAGYSFFSSSDNMATSMVDTVGDAAGTVADTATDVAGNMTDVATDVAEDVADVATDTIEGAADMVTDAITTGEVEIMLVDRLDGILSEYCLDIAGGNEDVDPANGLQAHTCYSYQGDLGTDQVFDAGAFADNSLSMPVYDVCASIADLAAGSEVALSACGDTATSISFNADGTLTPVAAPELCLTAAEESRMGRGSEHQIRYLTLESCSADAAAYQTWQARTAG